MRLFSLSTLSIYIISFVLIFFAPLSASAEFFSSSFCQPLPASQGETITVKNVAELKSAVQNKASNRTILLEDGEYDLTDAGFWVDGSSLTIRSKSGNRDAVILKGQGMGGGVTHVFWLAGSKITVADMTLGWVSQHPIQVHGELSADRVKIHNVRIVDGGQQLFKVSYDSSKPKVGADRGVVECSSFEYSAGIGPQYYIGGIDAHNARNWIVRDNVFSGIRSPESNVAEHAIHFWSDSKNTVVERNVIVNCDRGIGFGLGDRGHKGGIIRNNMLYHDSSRADVGIGLENARGAKVYNNSLFYESDYLNAIEYRFSGTKNVVIANNLTNKLITQREGGQARLFSNVTNAEKTWFQDPTSGDLHLSGAISGVVDQGRTLQKVLRDFDGEKRSKGKYDIGADEL